jgi:hypothetical protein
VSAVFYGFSNPNYRRIHATDVLYLLTVPEEAHPIVMRQSLRRVDSKTGESVDFLQEQRNMALKDWLPMEGVPTALQWIKASRSLQKLLTLLTKNEILSKCKLATQRPSVFIRNFMPVF